MFWSIEITKNVSSFLFSSFVYQMFNVCHLAVCTLSSELNKMNVYIWLCSFFSCRCTFRFPSTNIRIIFESYIDHPFEVPTKTSRAVENSNVIYAPLKISIPEHAEKRSPFPSPTGTISAANSCPTSPRQSYQIRGEAITFDRDIGNDHLLGTSASVYSSYNHLKQQNNNNHHNNSIAHLASSSGVGTSNNHDFETVSKWVKWIKSFDIELKRNKNINISQCDWI